MYSEITFIRYAESQNIYKPNILKVFGRKKTRRIAKKRPRSHMPEGQEF
jgi:hypothetical protein